jgi:hypothetical protein
MERGAGKKKLDLSKNAKEPGLYVSRWTLSRFLKESSMLCFKIISHLTDLLQ